jgi:hypothetical protein
MNSALGRRHYFAARNGTRWSRPHFIIELRWPWLDDIGHALRRCAK